MESFGYIYKTENLINGKIYIGQTIKKGRFLKNYLGSGNNIKNAIKKYNKKNFEKTILAECSNKEQMNRLEKLYISMLIPEYNITKGGDGTIGYRHTEKSKKTMSLKHKGKTLSKEHSRKIGEANKGHLVSDAQRKKMSEQTKKQWNDPESRRKLIENNKGYKKTEEHKKMISQANKGRKHTEEFKKTMSEKMKGRTFSKETLRKKSEALKGNKNNLGHKHSEETKQKMKNTWAKKRSELSNGNR